MRRRDRLMKNLPFGRHRSPARSTQPPVPQIASPSISATPSSTAAGGLHSSPTPADNPALQLAIQKHYDSLPEADKTFRSRSQTISKFLNLLQRFMAGVTTAVQASPDPSAIIIGIIQVVLNSALEIATFFDRLSGMIDRLSDYLDPLAEYARGARDSEIFGREVIAAYGDLLDFWTAARHVFVDLGGAQRKNTSLRTFLQVQWEQFETTFGDIEKRFAHHLDVLSHGSGALQFNAITKANNDRQLKEREEVLQWISEDDFEKSHEDKYRRKHPGTGNWLVQTDAFQQWFSHTGSMLLWCYGKRPMSSSI
ncbi:hypothetical protein AOQ84DRAFT_93057 [Glonium stellatum]|uniref:Fungal STAND N-terminal Goodbye domain-containing protein n=1 Tax=Glonium stellatum TaxID=574774 RepID=A0A8E2JQU1_9PEZI|nr:hypothetical protein AOQ84DRAFT_93057 [Glonium stellatum]